MTAYDSYTMQKQSNSTSIIFYCRFNSKLKSLRFIIVKVLNAKLRLLNRDVAL